MNRSELEFMRGLAVALDAEMERMLIAMHEMNKQIARDQAEFIEVQAETQAIVARLKERPPLVLPFENL